MRMPTVVGVFCVAASIVSAQTNSPGAAPKATVTLKSLIEKRQLSLEESPFKGWENGIELSLHVDGADVKGARKYGMVKVTKAVDDVGTDLSKKGAGPKTAEMNDFQEIREPMNFGDRSQPKRTGFDFDLTLPTPSARQATTLKTVSGSLELLVGGTKKVVVVKPIKASLGKTIEDPALKAVGVTFEIIDPAKKGKGDFFGPDTSKGVTVQISGNINEIANIDIVDSAGKKLNNGEMSQEEGGKRLINYGIDGALPSNAALHIEVWPGQKTITVPFEIKDVKLP